MTLNSPPVVPSAAEPTHPDREASAAALGLAEAGVLLAQRAPDCPAGFVALVYGQSLPEDLLRFSAEDLAQLAALTFSALRLRKRGEPQIRFDDPEAAGSATLPRLSVLTVVNDDMPFLVDSVMSELAEQNVTVRLVAHPVLTVTRNAEGVAGAVGPLNREAPLGRESLIQVHLDRIEPDWQARIVAALQGVLSDVRVCVADWRAMTARVADVVRELRENPPPLPVDEIAEAIQFLQWLAADNFTFLGIREHVLSQGADSLDPVSESGLGILRSPEARVLRRADDTVPITPEIRAFLRAPKPLIVTKAAMRSRVHRRVYLDYIGVKRFDRSGNLVGEFRIVGLFTSTAYTRSARAIPYLRRKVAAVMARAGFDADSHSGKALVNVLEHYSRDEMFQIDTDTLYEFAMAVLQLEERPRVRVLPRADEFHRFVAVTVYLPRQRYNDAVGAAVGAYLAKAYRGHVSTVYPYFPEGPLVRLHYIIGRRDGVTPSRDRAVLEQDVEHLTRSWHDNFALSLENTYEPLRARTLLARYAQAFPPGYQGDYPPEAAVADLHQIETLTAEKPLAVSLYAPEEGGPSQLGLKIWSCGKPIALTDRVPVLENMGFRVVDERTFELGGGAVPIWFHDMTLAHAQDAPIDLPARKAALEACFIQVMSGGAENDGYNALVLLAGLAWREAALLRALSRFLRQIRVPYSQDYLWTTMRRHPALATQIVALFEARFDPHAFAAPDARQAQQETQLVAIEDSLKAVENLDEDRILRHFVAVVRAAVRTNFYQLGADGLPKAEISVKYESRTIPLVPLPRPLYEIHVYSPRVEGIHLRFGKVARGGIRWSDRPQDFRTEILGLVKAQQVKNAVIVPVGSKGGFVPKRLPSGPREAIQQEGEAAYRIFISALLDLTDNYTGTNVTPPADVVRHDGDDPYLVVAADKGTATFSDLANTLSAEHGFWLDDAFASGGSAGYDHKKMGITARGAWESVKRHFREMDIDIHRTPFTVVGVGDMSGDVFGNGMLRERTIKLVAAFDHRDIFIDPAPDADKAFAERQRLFDLPRSSWQDYDKTLISQGGGVFSRGAKEIVLSAEAQAVLGVTQSAMTPQDVIRAILTAPVDLLFFGGIGTYIRAATESDEAAGDRSNDAVRVTGSVLRCKVIGEGANLGMTQRGRIEAALRGIRLNTDAIDNSAGVNTSDVEVNIKIALADPVREGKLSREARNQLLATMTDEVAALVLRNNYLQTLALSLAQRREFEDFGFQQRLIQHLEQRGLLDRAVEFLPDEMELTERRRKAQALTRPELAVLLAYAKLTLYDDLLLSPVPDDPYLARELGRYFPPELVSRFPETLQTHRLRREIIATQLSNSIINRGGPTLVVRIADQTGAGVGAIASAFAAVRDSYDMPALNGAIDALDNRVPGRLQLELYAACEDLLLDRLVWFLRNADLSAGLAAVVAQYKAGIDQVEAVLDSALGSEAATRRKTRATAYQAAGVPAALALKLASLPALSAAPDIALVATRANRPVGAVAAAYFAAEAEFRLGEIAAAARDIVVTDYFDRLALDRALDSIGDAERRMTAAIVATGAEGAAAVAAWAAPQEARVTRIRQGIQEIVGSGLTVSKLTVAASLLSDLVASA